MAEIENLASTLAVLVLLLALYALSRQLEGLARWGAWALLLVTTLGWVVVYSHYAETG